MDIVVVIKEEEAPEDGKQVSDNPGIGNKTILTLTSFHQSKFVVYT